MNFIPWGPAGIQVALSRKSPYVDTKHKVSGMMLANHTCMAELFKRALGQYDTIISRNAYLHQFRPEHAMFAEGNAEFDSCREVVQSLMDEYTAAEGLHYTTWGTHTPPTDDKSDTRTKTRYEEERDNHGQAESY